MLKLLLLLICINCVFPQELLTNPGFDEETDAPWTCSGSRAKCSVITTDNISPNNSMLVAERQKTWTGPRQSLITVLQLNKRYYAEGWVKVLTSPNEDTTPVPVQLLLTIKYLKPGGGSHWKTQKFDRQTITPGSGWVKLFGDLQMTDLSEGGTMDYAALAMEAGDSKRPAPYNDFIADSLSINEIVEDPQWREKAVAAAADNRKSDFTVTLKGSGRNRGYTNAKLKIKQIYSEFGFGSSVDAFLLKHKAEYQQTFLNTFKWGVLETDLSWRSTEFSPNTRTWESADMGMKILEDNDIRIRGGYIIDVNRAALPDYAANSVTRDDIYRHSMKRVDDLLGRYRYRCLHWDVAHGMLTAPTNFLSYKYRSESINTDLFERAKDVDYAAKLFISEVDLLTANSDKISEVVQKVKEFKKAEVPVDGIAVELNFNSAPSYTVLRHRLEKLGEAGVTVWITNYKYSHADPAVRGETLDKVLDLILGNANVGGFMLADFWDGHAQGENVTFFEGRDVTPNAAGEVLAGRASELTSLDTEVGTFDISANGVVPMPAGKLYHGTYEVSVLRSDDSLVTTRTITLAKDEGDKNYDLWF